MTPAHATTVVAVQRDGTVAVAGDGQVTVGDIVMKAARLEGPAPASTGRWSAVSPERSPTR